MPAAWRARRKASSGFVFFERTLAIMRLVTNGSRGPRRPVNRAGPCCGPASTPAGDYPRETGRRPPRRIARESCPRGSTAGRRRRAGLEQNDEAGCCPLRLCPCHQRLLCGQSHPPPHPAPEHDQLGSCRSARAKRHPATKLPATASAPRADPPVYGFSARNTASANTRPRRTGTAFPN